LGIFAAMDAAAFEDGRTAEPHRVRRATLRVLVVDGHRMFAEMLCVALERTDRIESCRRIEGVDEAIAELEAVPADVVVIDGDLSDPSAVDGARLIRQRWPATRILMLTTEPDVDLLADAAAAGVDAFRTKEGAYDELVETITSDAIEDLGDSDVLADLTEAIRQREAARAERDGLPIDLTPRERDILGLLSRGVPMKDMARLLGITVETCRGYVKSLLMKLDARSQLQAVVVAYRKGLLDDDDQSVDA
jgi:DNA-binding NarL/FixJ family response regulator